MKVQIELDDGIVREIDDIARRRRRSAFVQEAVPEAVDRHRYARRLRAAAGMFRDTEHEWDGDPAAWVSRQRGSDPRRVG